MPTGDMVQVNKRELVIPVDDGAGRGPGDSITVTNVSPDDIAFKMKTTNPNCYIVRPNVAFVPQNQSVDIRIFLAEGAPPPPPGASKDRFQLRVASAPGMGASAAGAGDFWRDHESDASQTRIRFSVKFVPYIGDDADARARAPDEPMPDADALLRRGAADEAAKKVAELDARTQERNAQVARLRTELAETRAAEERTLLEAPKTPVQANTLVSDPFGGLSVVAVGLIFVIVLLMYKLFL